MDHDPHRLRLLGAQLRRSAEQARVLAARVDRAAAVPWQSPAAVLFAERVGRAAAGVRRTADQLEEAADLADVHARAVDAALADLARLAREAAREAARAITRGVC